MRTLGVVCFDLVCVLLEFCPSMKVLKCQLNASTAVFLLYALFTPVECLARSVLGKRTKEILLEICFRSVIIYSYFEPCLLAFRVILVSFCVFVLLFPLYSLCQGLAASLHNKVPYLRNTSAQFGENILVIL